MNTEPLLEMKGIKLKFGDKTILNGVDLAVAAEEVLVIMGLSGGGKSTLLSVLLGLLPATAGSIYFKKSDLMKLPRPDLNRHRTQIGMVYQNAALISSLNTRDNVALPLEELSDKSADEIDHIVEEKLELVGLRDIEDKLPAELSGGMQKRVGLARALVLEPELILFDEPSAGLDPINTKKIDDIIINLKEEHGATSIVVTHQLESAFAIATRMAFLHEGKIILTGTPEEFRHSKNPIIHEFLESWDHAGDNHYANSSK